MKFTEFKRGVENGEVFPIYLFEGEETFFAKKGLNLLKEKFLTEPSLNLANFEGNDLDLNEVVSSALAYPFMSEKRLTVINEFYPKASALKEIKNAFSDLPQTAIVIILNTQKSDALSKLEGVCLVSCVKEDATSVAKWIKAECASFGVAIELENAKTLAEYCLSDMTRVQVEVKKLCDFVGDNGVIDSGVIDELIFKDSEHKIYEMTDYIAKKKFDLALSVIEDMLAKGEPPQKIMTSVYYYFRKLLHVSISSQSLSELSESLGVKEFAVKKLKEQASKFTKRGLKQAVDYLIESDILIKSGKAGELEQLWLSIFNVMTK